jgi:hypothetical protein
VLNVGEVVDGTLLWIEGGLNVGEVGEGALNVGEVGIKGD